MKPNVPSHSFSRIDESSAKRASGKMRIIWELDCESERLLFAQVAIFPVDLLSAI